jgi:(5-formylfuran-3-yl)methyl phosphate synthase
MTAQSVQALVSVRDEAEALLAAAAGVPLIDLKEPHRGALGGLPPERVRAIVGALRTAGFAGEISATIGDHAAGDLAAIAAGIDALAGTAVDVVKVGVMPGAGSAALIAALAERAQRGECLVPVLIADDGLATLPLADALAAPFHAVMLDTQAKAGGSLIDRVGVAALADFVRACRRAGRRCGLAGSLRQAELPTLIALAPDYAGFRGAVCEGDRRGALEAARLAALVGALRPDGSDAASAPPEPALSSA